jgi:hypothetical protein
MSEVRFVGGPADGMFREYPGARPPELVEVYAPRFDTDPAVVVSTRILYATRVSPFADGPLWIAVLLEDEP